MVSYAYTPVSLLVCSGSAVSGFVNTGGASSIGSKMFCFWGKVTLFWWEVFAFLSALDAPTVKSCVRNQVSNFPSNSTRSNLLM